MPESASARSGRPKQASVGKHVDRGDRGVLLADLDGNLDACRLPENERLGAHRFLDINNWLANGCGGLQGGIQEQPARKTSEMLNVSFHD